MRQQATGVFNRRHGDFDIAAAKVESSLTGYGGNGGTTVNRKLGQYYHSTSGGTLW